MVIDEQAALPKRETGWQGRTLQPAKNPKPAWTIGRASRKQIEGHFPVERSIDRLSAIIRSCVAGCHEPGASMR
jgi:hypothetical protein